MSDQVSMTNSLFDNNNSNSISTLSKKRYKQWTEEDEQKLLEILKLKQKSLQDLSDIDWSEIAQKFNLVPQQIYWKAKRLQKEAN